MNLISRRRFRTPGLVHTYSFFERQRSCRIFFTVLRTNPTRDIGEFMQTAFRSHILSCLDQFHWSRSVHLLMSLILLCVSTDGMHAQDVNNHDFITYPGVIAPWTIRSAIGLSVTILPRPIVEEELRQVPMLTAEARIGLPWNLSATGRAGTNVLTTAAGFGAQWSLTLGRVAFSLGDEQAFWYGFATVDGFDLDAQGWLNFPSVSAGIALDDFILSLKTEAQIVTFQKTVAGTTEVLSSKNTLSGVAFTLAVEQPFWAGQYVKLGAKINYARQMYHAWLAFGTFKEFLTYPEFFVVLIF